MSTDQPFDEFITYGFKAYIYKKIDGFSKTIEKDYQELKNEQKTYQMKLIIHLKNFNKIISDSVFMVFKLTEKKNQQKVFGRVANQLYGFYKQFKENEILKYFGTVQQLYLLLIVLIYGSLLIHQRNQNLDDVKNYKIKIQNHLLYIFEKYINKGFHKSEISCYLYYQILNQIPLSLLSSSFFDQLKSILKDVEFNDLLEQIQQLREEFQSFIQDPNIQQSFERKKSFIDMNTQSGDRIKNKKKTTNKKADLLKLQNQKVELDLQKKNDARKYIISYAKKEGLIDDNVNFGYIKKKIQDKKKAFILQKEDYHKINRNNFDNFLNQESSFQVSLRTGMNVQKDNSKRQKKIKKRRLNIFGCNQIAFQILKSQKNIHVANNLCLMNIKERINNKQKMYKKIQSLKKTTAKIKRKQENLLKQQELSNSSSYSYRDSIINSYNYDQQDKDQKIDEQNIDNNVLNKNIKKIKGKFNFSVNHDDEGQEQKFQKVKYLKNYYTKEKDTVVFKDNFSQNHSIKHNTILQNIDQQNTQGYYLDGLSDTKNNNDSIDDIERAKLMSQRISKLLKKEFMFPFTKTQFEIEQLNNKNMCNLSCTF